MSSLSDFRRPVNARPLDEGNPRSTRDEIEASGARAQDELLNSLDRPRPFTAADLAEAAQIFGPTTADYEIVLTGLKPIRGGAPTAASLPDDGASTWGPETDAFVWELGPGVELDVDEMILGALDDMAKTLDRLERGQDHGDSQARSLIGLPA